MGSEVSIDQGKWMSGELMENEYEKIRKKLTDEGVTILQMAYVLKKSDTVGRWNCRLLIHTSNSMLLYKPMMGGTAKKNVFRHYGTFHRNSIKAVGLSAGGGVDLRLTATGVKAGKSGTYTLEFKIQSTCRDPNNKARIYLKDQWAKRVKDWFLENGVDGGIASLTSNNSMSSNSSSSSSGGTRRPGTRRVVVRCPDGVGPGQNVNIRVGSRTLTVRVPPGVTSGKMFAVMVPVESSNDDDDDDDDDESTKRPDMSVRVSKAKKKTFATRKANTLQRKQSRFRFKFDNSGTMRFFRDNGMREDRRDMAPPLSKKSTESEYQKLYRAAKEEDKAWEDFLRMMGADVGASRSDLRGIFEESRKAAGMSHTAQEDLRKFLDTHPGMGDATTQAWVRRFSKSGRLHLTPALTGSLGAPVNKTGQTYEALAAISMMPFKKKSEWFVNKMKGMMIPFENGHVDVVIRRDLLLEDSAKKINLLSTDELHQIWRIYFKNAQYATAVSVVDNDDGATTSPDAHASALSQPSSKSSDGSEDEVPVTYVFEAGIDAGGLTRAWFESITHLFFDMDYGLFKFSGTDNLTYQINPLSAMAQPNHLLYFHFLGRVMGRALLTQQVMPAPLTRPLYKHLLGYPVTFNDLQYVDPDLHKNLAKLLKMSAANIENAYLDFTVTLPSQLGKAEQLVELRPGGEDEDVTAENIDDYVALIAKWYCYDSIKDQLEAMLRGFYAVVPESFLCVFDHQELELMLCGMPCIDVDDWKRNTEFKDGYTARSKQVKWFWEVVRTFDEEQKARLLQFCTGTSRVPIGGFRTLQSNNGKIKKFCIQKVKDTKKLPVAHTCFNRIELPTYRSRSRVEEVLNVILKLDLELMGFNIQ
eukprot:g7158.t1